MVDAGFGIRSLFTYLKNANISPIGIKSILSSKLCEIDSNKTPSNWLEQAQKAFNMPPTRLFLNQNMTAKCF